MILTITLNPAVDKTYTTGALLLGRVNRMNSVKNLAGGKGINVAKILRQYGQEVTCGGFLGGYAGSFIKDYMEGILAGCVFTHVKEETRSSINVIAQDGYVTEILEPGPLISQDELSDFIEAYKSLVPECELVVLSGSVPKGVPADIYGQLIAIAHAAGKKTLLDTSGEALLHGVKASPYMIKPNQKELEYLVGHKLKDMGELAQAAKKLHQNGIAHVLVSMGKKGLLSVGKEGAFWAKVPVVSTRNTVGCGDSVVAAFAMSLQEGDSGLLTIKKAAAISAANAATLESGQVDSLLAKELLEQILVEPVS